MRRTKKIIATLLTGFGLFVSLVFVSDLFLNASTSDKQGGVVVFLVMGLPPLAAGTWMFWQEHQQRQQQKRNQLRSTFFRLLQAQNGRISLIQFAMETGLEGKDAKSYLDERAKEFNAAYDITREGSVSYYFELGELGDSGSQLPPK